MLVYHKWQSYDYGSWDMERDENFLSFQVIFCPFTHPTDSSKNLKISKKCSKTSGDIILRMCTINDSYIMNGS